VLLPAISTLATLRPFPFPSFDFVGNFPHLSLSLYACGRSVSYLLRISTRLSSFGVTDPPEIPPHLSPRIPKVFQFALPAPTDPPPLPPPPRQRTELFIYPVPAPPSSPITVVSAFADPLLFYPKRQDTHPLFGFLSGKAPGAILSSPPFLK